jgi:transcriptional regulator with XRE-family HTH domain
MQACIATIRKRQGLSQEALAARVNVTQEVISRIETDKRHLRVSELSLFAHALGCSIEDLLGNLSPQAVPAHPEGD